MPMATGILTCLLVVVVVVSPGAVFAQDDYGNTDDCCPGDHSGDLDPGIGLLAEQRVMVTVRRSSLSLHCAVAAEPQFGNLTFAWRREGDVIQSRSPRARRYTYPNGTLHIRKIVHRTKEGVRISDEGMYECLVTNAVGTVIAQRIELIVASLGKTLTLHPTGGTISVGDNFYLPCQLKASPQDLMVVWQKDTTLLITDSSRHIRTEDGLLILNAQVEDSGTYQCQVTNKNFFTFVHDDSVSPQQWRDSRPAKLLVKPDPKAEKEDGDQEKPPFLLTPPNVTDVLAGDSVDLHCVPATFQADAISWCRTDSSKPDTSVAIKGSSDFEFLPGGSLRILRANRKLAGTYTCLHSPSDNSVSTELRVLEEPVIQDSTPSRVYPLARSVRLDCVVAGQPPPSIRWFKNGQEITMVRYRVEFIKEALLIYQGNMDDSGYYQCLAENEIGWSLSLTRVAVRIEPDAPSPPFNLTGEALSSSRIVVRWEMDQASGNLLSFTIHKRLAQEDGGEEAEIVDSQWRQAVLYGLLPDTLYAITVRAYNKGGASPSSDPVFIRTDLTGFPSPVVASVSNSSISLNWSDFHLRHRRKEDIASYQVYYGLSNSQDVDEVVLDTSQDSMVLTARVSAVYVADLEENREYRVRMKATFKGDNPAVHDETWPWSYIRTGNASLPTLNTHLAAPFNLKAVPLQPDAISLSWTYSSQGLKASVPVTHYTVRCQMLESMVSGASCQNVDPQSIIIKTSHSNMATLDKLKAFTLYNISVAAHSDSLQGPYSRPILVQTKEDVPSRPENLEAEVVSEGQVRLQWQPPMWPNGLIQGHYIQYINQKYKAITATSTLVNASWVQLYQRGNMTMATVSNLTQRVYIFKVLACTSAGRGDPSTLVFVHMGDVQSRSGLSDQHLGILGGSVIGLTSILITVIVIVCKQRQLQKQLEIRYKLEQGRQTMSRSCDLQSPVYLPSQLAPSSVRSEELEQLLNVHAPCLSHPFHPSTTAATNPTNPTPTSDSDSRDSGCSSSPPQGEVDVVINDRRENDGLLVTEDAVWNTATKTDSPSEDRVKHCDDGLLQQKETMC